MGKYNGAVITTAGQNMIAQAIAQSQTITFMTMDASSHVYPTSTNFESLTSLEDVESTININYAGVYNNNVVQVSGRFDNDGVETPYLINTIGLYAKLGTDAALLFAVVTAITPDQMPVFDADNPSAFIYNIQMTVQNANSVSVAINPAGTVTVEQIGLIVNEIESKIETRAPINHAIANTTYGGGNATNYGHVQLSDSYDTVNNNQKAANSVGASAWALQSVKALVGALNNLTTTVKSTIVGAINELKTAVDSKLDATANAVSATKLLNSRNFRTNLGSTSTAGFDGSADCNPGVTGTLAVANGGTGQTTLAKARNAMGLGDTTGALPVANGGTGQTTLALARNAMGLGNTTGALPIANGGTGKTTAADARSALGVAYGTTAGTVCQGNDSRLSNSRTPTSHASTGTGYGAGNASNYGHVKVSDNYTSSAGNASQSVAASSQAVVNTYNALHALKPQFFYIGPGETETFDSFIFVIMTGYNRDQKTNIPFCLYENGSYNVHVHGEDINNMVTVTNMKSIKNNDSSRWLCGIVFY